MRLSRPARVVVGSALVVGALVAGARVREARADLENGVFTARGDRVRLLVPRGWRATDQPSYPGMLLWMGRSQPPGQMVLTAEPFTRALYCSWPVACRTSSDDLSTKHACALRARLQALRMRVGPTQAGPRDNEAAGLPSVWFEYDDGRRFMRHAVAVAEDRVVSLVLSSPTDEARATHERAFEQALRTLRRPRPEAEAATDGGAAAGGAAGADDSAARGAATGAGDAGDAASAPAALPAPTTGPTPPPVGPCPVTRDPR